jgi:hypothetical protein
MTYAIAEPGIDALDHAWVEEYLDTHPVAGHPPVST